MYLDPTLSNTHEKMQHIGNSLHLIPLHSTLVLISRVSSAILTTGVFIDLYKLHFTTFQVQVIHAFIHQNNS